MTASADDLESAWFRHAPFGMLVLDRQGRIVQANRALESLIGLPISQLLGHSRDTLPSPTHRVLFAESVRIHLNGPGAPERWLYCETHSEDDKTIRYFSDITRERALEAENRDLVERIEATRVNDPLTGLPNQRAITHQLELQVSRSRRYGNPLSIALIRVHMELPENSIHREARDPVLLSVSRYLRDRLRWVDQIARWDNDAFLTVLPETDENAARQLLAKISAETDQIDLPELFHRVGIGLTVGVAGWQKGDDAHTLIRRSNQESHPAIASSA
jgi:diguanylate cyclase (GGDEF)-like protein